MTQENQPNQPRRRRPPTGLLLGVLVIVALGNGLIAAYALSRAQNANTGGDMVTTLPRAVRSVELTSDTGNPITLNDLRGSYTLMAFGYTHCPDVCPLTLTEFRQVKRELTDAEAEQVTFAFVSVDGERDTPDLLNHYVKRFDEAFIGITTDDEERLQQITGAFGVYYERRTVEGTQAAYMVDHTATTFLLAPNGNIVARYAFGTPAVEIAEDIRARF